MDGTEIAVAAVAGALAVAGTLLGVVVKGRVDRRQFDLEVAARRADQLLDRRLAAGAAMVEALVRARAELDAKLAEADGDGYGPDGSPTFLTVPGDRPAWLLAALHSLELTSTPPVIDAARVGATWCWDSYRQAVLTELRCVHRASRHGNDGATEAAIDAQNARQEASFQAMDAEERLRDAIRAESRRTDL